MNDTFLMSVVGWDSQFTRFHPQYVDWLDGDHLAALMLCQIEYWYLPDKDGHPKIKVHKHGKYWLAKSHVDWWDELRFTRGQATRGLAKLKSAGLVETRTMRFDGVPVIHLRSTLIEGRVAPYGFYPLLIARFQAINCTETSNPLHESEQYLTETTAESTAENKSLALPASGPTPEENMAKGDSSKELLKQLQIKKQTASGSVKLTPQGVYESWCVLAPKYNPELKFVAKFTDDNVRQSKLLLKDWGDRTQKVLTFVLKNWVAFTKYAEVNAGAYKTPMLPNVSFLAKYREAALNFFLADAANCTEGVAKPKKGVLLDKASIPVTLAAPAKAPSLNEDDVTTYEDILAYEAKLKPPES